MRRALYLILPILLFGYSFGGNAQTAISPGSAALNFDPNAGVQTLSNYMYVYEDTSGKLGISDISHITTFKLNTAKTPNLGVTASTIWFRVTIVNNSQRRMLLEVENPLLEHVSIYTPDSNGNGFTERVAGKYMPFSSRDIKNHDYVFELRQPEGRSVTYYLKVKSNTQLLVPMKIGTLDGMATADLNRDLFSGLYFGIMLVMFLYNLFVWLSVKDKSYLYYVLYILCVTLVQLNITGFGFKYLWPNAPGFERFSVYLFPSLTAFASIAFIRQFLNTSKYVPKTDIGFAIIVLAYLFTLGNALWGDKLLAYNLTNANALPLSLFMIGIAAYLRVKYKSRPAAFFLIAWTVFLFSIVAFVIKDLGLLPYNLLTVSSIQIGSSIEVVLLSIALADRINVLTKEKEESQAQALLALQENARIIREQNVVLEAKVEERTIELKGANEDLNKAMKELKDAETHLVESEKMASLGQLTAGIAHEINNPINFVTSNVKPLSRDVRILLEVVEQLETIMKSDSTRAEKEKEIEEYKEEIDYGYLKEEIDSLLKGIGEGASRTAEIVKGLRVFSRLDEDDLKKADINEGIDSTLVIINNLLNGKVQVVKKYGNIPLIECYPGKLNQVFLNIMSNGIYAITKQHEHDNDGRLTITTSNDETYVYISIADNGTGMDEKTKKKLFEPFFTTKDVGEGTGLGLSIVYNTIAKHNGEIEVNSVVGQGTEFIIKLPIIH